jgi:hypothetical protein
MTVLELIVELQKRPDQNGEVLVNVRVETSRYGLAQITPWAISGGYSAGAVLEVTLPEGMYIAKRKH